MKRWLSLLLALCLCVVVMLALCASVSAKSECRLYDMTLKTESGEVLDGVVTDVIKGGLLAVTNGVRVFIPEIPSRYIRRLC